MKKFIYLAAAVAASSLTFTSCSDDDDLPDVPPVPSTVDGLFVVCNGNYLAGNGSLSYYTPSDNSVENDVFQRANGMKLGDTAQSMSIDGETGWICVNGSNVMYAIDVNTYKVKGHVTDIASPRNALVVGDHKMYVTALYDNRIAIVDPSTYSVTGHIEVPDMDAATGSTEQMVKVGDYVYVNCWSYQKEILKIDTRNDKVVDRIEVGLQPQSIAYDSRNNALWVLCDGGGYATNPIGYEAPSISRINLGTFKVESTIGLAQYSSVSHLRYYNGNLFWLESGVQRMSTSASEAPAEAFIPSASYGLYALDINPVNGDIYVGDAIDYMQAGAVTRYNASGEKIDSFNTGIIPAGFCWKFGK